VIAFDAPGVGKSPTPLLPYRLREIARLAEALLDTWGRGRRRGRRLVGRRGAQEFALRNPRRCATLTLAASWTGLAPMPTARRSPGSAACCASDRTCCACIRRGCPTRPARPPVPDARALGLDELAPAAPARLAHPGADGRRRPRRTGDQRPPRRVAPAACDARDRDRRPICSRSPAARLPAASKASSLRTRCWWRRADGRASAHRLRLRRDLPLVRDRAARAGGSDRPPGRRAKGRTAPAAVRAESGHPDGGRADRRLRSAQARRRCRRAGGAAGVHPPARRRGRPHAGRAHPRLQHLRRAPAAGLGRPAWPGARAQARAAAALPRAWREPGPARRAAARGCRRGRLDDQRHARSWPALPTPTKCGAACACGSCAASTRCRR
jgi:hypothetical protein